MMDYEFPKLSAENYTRFPPRSDLHPMDVNRLKDDYERQMRHEFCGRNPDVLGTQLSPRYFVPREDGVKQHDKGKSFMRHLVAVELDQWVREPDPVPTLGKRFLAFVGIGGELPQSEIPPRIIKHYDISQMQYSILKDLWEKFA